MQGSVSGGHPAIVQAQINVVETALANAWQHVSLRHKILKSSPGKIAPQLYGGSDSSEAASSSALPLVNVECIPSQQ
jgi:hypothetical protein